MVPCPGSSMTTSTRCRQLHLHSTSTITLRSCQLLPNHAPSFCHSTVTSLHLHTSLCPPYKTRVGVYEEIVLVFCDVLSSSGVESIALFHRITNFYGNWVLIESADILRVSIVLSDPSLLRQPKRSQPLTMHRQRLSPG